MAQLICHHLSVGYDSKAVLTDTNFDTYNSLTPNWYYKVLR